MPKLGDAVGLSAIFQPLLPLPVHAHLKKNETFILPSQGCFNGVFLFLAHGVLNKRQTRSVVAASVSGRVDPVLRQTHGTFPRMRSIWFRECGQDLWTMCKGVV